MMDEKNECSNTQDAVSPADHQWFYAKSKVPICLAITKGLTFLDKLKGVDILSEEESLELQADTRPVHRIVYECLCWIEEKNIDLQHFFEHLFQKSYLKIYPDLKPILQEYEEENYRKDTQSSVDMDKDQLIFAQEKVPICLAITDRFPFLHGLQDLTILSDIESLKLQADERPVSRVIYECLSLIEKKDMKLNVVFEYIFQQCYLKAYPGLQAILQEPNEQAGPFNGRSYPVFSRPGDLLDFFEHNKTYFAEAIDERFPFLHGLHDIGLLPKLQLLKLQADKRPTKKVLYNALCLIEQKSDVEICFTYVFQELYLKLYPDLNMILKSLNAALMLEMCPSSPEQVGDLKEEDESSGSSTDYIPMSVLMNLKDGMCLQSTHEETEDSDLADALMLPIRTCRIKSINYTEPPDFDLEPVNGRKRHRAPGCSLQQNIRKRRVKETKFHIPTDHNRDSDEEQKWMGVTNNVTVKLEFPKQVFSEEFQVKCGNKKGIFLKKYWTGNSRHDSCIRSDGNKFSVTKFEKYGGKEASKNWKKSIRCEKITLETLIKSSVLKSPTTIKINGSLKTTK